MNSTGNTAFSARLGNNRGFTMIEMAIVLVIIGIIMGAIMKGQDLIRGAQAKEVANGFVGKWQTIADTYYDKTGRNLGDGASDGGTGSPTGFMKELSLDSSTGAVYVDNAKNVYTALTRAGIDPCAIVKSNITKTTPAGGCSDGLDFGDYLVDSQQGKTNVAVGTGNYLIGASGPRKNVLVFRDVPGDVAIAIDKIYDGVENGLVGKVINISSTLPTIGTALTPLVWATTGNYMVVILDH